MIVGREHLILKSVDTLEETLSYLKGEEVAFLPLPRVPREVFKSPAARVKVQDWPNLYLHEVCKIPGKSNS